MFSNNYDYEMLILSVCLENITNFKTSSLLYFIRTVHRIIKFRVILRKYVVKIFGCEINSNTY